MYPFSWKKKQNLNGITVQAGIPHIIDTRNIAWPVSIDAVLGFVENPRREYIDVGYNPVVNTSTGFQFPLARSGPGITQQQRMARGISGPGYLERMTAQDRNESMMLFMRSHRGQRLFNVSQEELDRVRRKPSAIRAVRVR